MNEEKQFFVPHISGRLGKTFDETKQLEQRLIDFTPTVKVVWYSVNL